MVVDEVRTLFFDCDDTLYPHNKVSPTVRNNIDKFIQERLSLPFEKASKLRKDLFEKYGTTLRGLQQRYHVDAIEYWHYIHGTLAYETLIQPDLQMAQLLSTIDRSRFRSMYIFTNADYNHALACLRALKIPLDIFDGVIDVQRLDFCNKPEEGAYRTALQVAGEKEPRRAILFDDSHRNVKGAHEHGLNAVHVITKEDDRERKFAYFPPHKGLPNAIWSLHELPTALPYLFEANTVKSVV